jgi:DNA polymerase
MTTLHIDFETRSEIDLRDTGVYVYAADASTDIWCAAFAVDDGPVGLWEPCKVLGVPKTIRRAVREDWPIIAHNANFERAIWAGVLAPRYGWPLPKKEQWQCTMAMALAMSLPASLQNAAAAVGLDQGKDMGGRDLMLRMARPRKARKGEDPKEIHWFDDEERLNRLYSYCRQDVEVERQLHKRLLSLRPSEQRLWVLDQVINDRGIYVDTSLCSAALRVVATAKAWLDKEITTLTGGAVSKTTNVTQIAKWLRENGTPTTSLDKDAIDDLLLQNDLRADVRRVLEIRREAAKASVSKIETLIEGKNDDGRARGLLQFHAAGTGRWAGRRFQPQNIKRPEIEDVDGAIDAVATGSAEYVQCVYGEPLAVVGDTLRGMVRAAPGNRILAADFSNIEGRLIAWLAGEEWKVDAFRAFDGGTGHDIYKLAYARSFAVPPGSVSKSDRQVGKVMELALGYQGGVGAFQKMAVGYGVEVSDERADDLKVMWREAHPNVVRYWYDLENSGKRAINNPGMTFDVGDGRVKFKKAGSFLFMRLPSGRSIVYPYPCIKDKMTPWGEMRPQICYQGVDTYTHKWGDQFAHGGLLFNNAVQGTARDIESEAMTRLEIHRYETGDPTQHGIVLTVHDEIVCEVPIEFGSVEEFERIMTIVPAWAAGLPVAADAWEGERYRK